MALDTKTALLDSAETVVCARGFDGFSYADLALDVGIRKASIHHHFATKAILSTALMKRYTTEINNTLERIDIKQSYGAEKLRTVVQLYRNALKDGNSLCLCVAMTVSHNNLCPEVVVSMRKFRIMVQEWLTQIFQKGHQDGSILRLTDASQDAAATLSLLEGAQLAARSVQDCSAFDHAVSQLLSRCRNIT